MLSARPLERLASTAARALWPFVERWNARFERKSPRPKWAPGPLLKRRERSFPTLGWPRETDSLCPRCVKETRTAILDGTKALSELVHGKPGEIRARIVEEDGQIWMRKTCDKHGDFADLMAMDAQWMARIERLYPGRDFKSPWNELRQHGTSSIQFGRGSVLTVDLTNRCNMMCDPCFMDANQVGFVHELGWADIQKILDDSMSIQPRRQMSVQFSGGEPTLSPFFLDAISYARRIGYFAVQCATNGLRFAEEPGFARKAKAAGLRMAYLQFDGVGNEANQHRKVGNLFDVKLRAIEELAAAGIDVILVVTVVNGVNNDQIGKILQFAVDNPDKITVVSFQPVSFTGRDEDIDDETRQKQRYTLSHLAHDVKAQTGVTEPLRDWFPLSAMGPFSDLVDHLMGERADWGAMKCGCHPNCGVGTILMVHKQTRQLVPLTQFLDLEALLVDIQAITDAAQGRKLTIAELVLALLKNYRAELAPPGFTFETLVKQLISQTGARGDAIGEYESDAREFEWRVLFVAGMWFQDLFNYDFRRTEMCIIPYGTQMGEISFCAYNTGVGWRNIVEKMLANATVADWYREHGRHKIYAKGQAFPIAPFEGPITARLRGEPLRLRVLTQAGEVGRSSPYVSIEDERKRAPAPGRAVPFFLLTGFLGAGKTTLLNRLLSAPQGRRIAVLVNDVGQINVDRKLLAAQAGDIIELSGGCVCCQVDLQRDLWSGVDDLIERARPDVVVLETTGIADPRVLLEAFDRVPERKRAVVPSGVSCVVDAEVGLEGAARPEWRAQLEAADRIVLTKLDRAAPSALPVLHARLAELAPRAERAAFPATEEGTLALARFLLEERRAPRAKAGRPAHRHSQLQVSSFVDDAPLLEAPLRALIDELGAALVRLKGHARLVTDGGVRSAYLERAGKTTSVTDVAHIADLRAELVFIVDGGQPGALDEAVLRRRLWACRAS